MDVKKAHGKKKKKKEAILNSREIKQKGYSTLISIYSFLYSFYLECWALITFKAGDPDKRGIITPLHLQM